MGAVAVGGGDGGDGGWWEASERFRMFLASVLGPLGIRCRVWICRLDPTLHPFAVVKWAMPSGKDELCTESAWKVKRTLVS